MLFSILRGSTGNLQKVRVSNKRNQLPSILGQVVISTDKIIMFYSALLFYSVANMDNGIFH